MPAIAVVSLVLLPLAGLWLAWLTPPGLIDPPPITADRVWPLVGRTLALALMVAFGSAALGTALAWTQHRAAWRGRKVMTALAILPLAVPSYLLAAIVREGMAPRGWAGELLGRDGAFTGFWPAVMVLTVACVPYAQLMVGASLERLSIAEQEAARSLGAGPWRRFRTLVLPRLRPAWALSMVLVTLYVVSDFGAVAVLDCEVLTWELYKASGSRDAVVLAGCIVACVVPLIAGFRLLHGRTESERPSGGPRSADLPRLRGGWLAGTWALHLGVVGLGVVLPTVALVSWVAAGLEHGVRFASLSGPLMNTAMFTVVAASLTLTLALGPAWVAARDTRRFGGWLDHGVHLTSSLPGVLVGFGVLQLSLGLRREVPLGDGTFWTGLSAAGVFLMLGYAMRFMALAVDTLEPVILRLDPRQDEVARSLGAGAWRRWRSVTMPQLAPGLVAAWLLVFLAVAKELPITLMLTPLGKQTLAYRIFDAQQEGSLPDVGAGGLTLLGLALLVFTIARTARGRAHGVA